MTEPPSAQAIVDQLKAARVEFVIRVPDRTTSRLSELIEQDPSFTLVSVCKEDEGVSICAALSFGDKRAVLLIQHTGVLDSVNSLRSVASEMRFPLVMIVGLLGKPRGTKPTDASSFGVRITEPVLDILNVPHLLVDDSGDEARIAGLIEEAYTIPQPAAILVGAGLV
ncbi:MAG: thiamine pyrophosphate-binding protein [Dehalococcoidia bacterium]|nr:thiamine pyrophosphate-binding protein [Dehalococcoidia bacterium]